MLMKSEAQKKETVFIVSKDGLVDDLFGRSIKLTTIEIDFKSFLWMFQNLFSVIILLTLNNIYKI